MKNTLKIVCFFLLNFNLTKIVTSEGYKEYDKLKLAFTDGSGMGMFLAIALPLEAPYNHAYLSFLFEANYPLPSNQTNLQYPPVVSRELIYRAMENKIESGGYPGRACLLRTICESATTQIKHTNGVLGDLFHVIFSPSASKTEKEMTEYELAEEHGHKLDNCKDYNKNCTVSFLDLISWIENTV